MVTQPHCDGIQLHIGETWPPRLRGEGRPLAEEAHHEISVQDGKGRSWDFVIVAGMQRIEHYEIAAYGPNIALAEALDEKEVGACCPRNA